MNYCPESFINEAKLMIKYFGGFVPKERDWKEQCQEFFEKINLDNIHWDTVYYEALTLENYYAK